MQHVPEQCRPLLSPWGAMQRRRWQVSAVCYRVELPDDQRLPHCAGHEQHCPGRRQEEGEGVAEEET